MGKEYPQIKTWPLNLEFSIEEMKQVLESRGLEVFDPGNTYYKSVFNNGINKTHLIKETYKYWVKNPDTKEVLGALEPVFTKVIKEAILHNIFYINKNMLKMEY